MTREISVNILNCRMVNGEHSYESHCTTQYEANNENKQIKHGFSNLLDALEGGGGLVVVLQSLFLGRQRLLGSALHCVDAVHQVAL